jgi:hypothetical protein
VASPPSRGTRALPQSLPCRRSSSRRATRSRRTRGSDRARRLRDATGSSPWRLRRRVRRLSARARVRTGSGRPTDPDRDFDRPAGAAHDRTRRHVGALSGPRFPRAAPSFRRSRSAGLAPGPSERPAPARLLPRGGGFAWAKRSMALWSSPLASFQKSLQRGERSASPERRSGMQGVGRKTWSSGAI